MTGFSAGSKSPGIPTTAARAIARAHPGWPGTWEDALTAARQFLAATADITPGTPAKDLLDYAARYRVHLATLVAAASQLGQSGSS